MTTIFAQKDDLRIHDDDIEFLLSHFLELSDFSNQLSCFEAEQIISQICQAHHQSVDKFYQHVPTCGQHLASFLSNSGKLLGNMWPVLGVELF